MKNHQKTCLILLFGVMFCISSCAHKSTVSPSTGHIDSQATTSHNQASVYQKPLSQTPNITNTAPNVADIPQPINNIVYLPPPTAKPKEQVYSIVVYNTPVKEVLFAIARDSNLNVDIHPSIQGNVTINAVDQTLAAILERLSKQVDLTYQLQNNVLTITPDQPVLRSYKVDYVNMSRDTKGFIGAAAEIATAGRAAATGAGGAGGQAGGATGGQSSTGGGGTGAATNSSRSSVSSEAKNHLWESLIANIKELLLETDKEVIVGRFGSSSESQAVGANPSDLNAAKTKSDQQQSEYKTLFAANVIANAETGVISVRATNKQHEKVEEFINRVMSSAKKQVLIEATIVEVRLNDSFQAGIDWSRLGGGGASSGFTFGQSLNAGALNPGSLNVRGTNAVNGLGTNTGLVAGYFNPATSLGAIAASISLLKQFGDTKVLSSPKLMVLNNQTAVLKVVSNLVYFTIQSQITQGNPTVVGGELNPNNLRAYTTTPNTIPVGVVMSVTPQINDLGVVNINVRPTISSLIRYVPDPNPDVPATQNSGIPEIRVQEMESLLQIGSGNIAVLGGLMQDSIQVNSDRVPGLSDIPGVGNVFKGRNDSNSKTELVIFLRPTVITNASLESDELSTYKKYLPSEQLKRGLETDSAN